MTGTKKIFGMTDVTPAQLKAGDEFYNPDTGTLAWVALENAVIHSRRNPSDDRVTCRVRHHPDCGRDTRLWYGSDDVVLHVKRPKGSS